VRQELLVPGIIHSWGLDSSTGIPVNAAHATNRATLFHLIFDEAELGSPRAQCKPNFCTSDSHEQACNLKKRLAPQYPNMASAFLYPKKIDASTPASAAQSTPPSEAILNSSPTTPDSSP
jgi:hypothetical protein